MKRRDFLKTIGIGAAVTVLPAEVCQVRPEEVVTFPATEDWGEVTESIIVDKEGKELHHSKRFTVALFSDMATVDGGGTEVVYNGYERQSVDMNFDRNDLFTTGVTNQDVVTFPEVKGHPQGADPLLVVSTAIYDGENMIFFQQLDRNMYLHNGDRFSFEKGNLSISFT